VWVRAQLWKLQKGCTRLAAASDKVCQLLAHGRWFSPGTPISSITKTGRHDIAEILLKVALNTKNKKKNNQITVTMKCTTAIKALFLMFIYIHILTFTLSLCRSPFILL
jgi:hypothetical protein